MANPGDSFRSTWTAAFYNRLQAALKQLDQITGTGGAVVSKGKSGIQISVKPQRSPVSTLQGILAGGSAPSVSDGTTIIDLSAFNAYSITAGAFVLGAGTTNLTVAVNGTPVSWLNNLAITTTLLLKNIPTPPPDLTHVLDPGDQLTIVLSGSSGASGLSFSLNTPF